MSTNKKQKKNREPQKDQKFLIINNVFKFDKKSESFATWDFINSRHYFGYEGIEEWEWPEYNNDKLRIRANSEKYANHTITEAFEEEYNLDINILDAGVEETPINPVLGGLIPVNIMSRNGLVIVNSPRIKSEIYLMNDLNKYSRFKHNNLDLSNIQAKVTDIRKHEVRINILEAITDKFVLSRTQNPWRQKIWGNPEAITVKDLKLTRGGFLGKAVIPEVSRFIGEEYTVDAFIPGSQIVLNITDDFESFEGKTVKAFVINYMNKPTGDGMSLICSVKEYLKTLGEQEMISLHKIWCDDSREWDKQSNLLHIGVVTGVINSSKKCGVFVEITDLNITGMISVPARDLNKYKPGNVLMVRIIGFEDEMYYNATVNQMQHVEPYKITDGCIEKCNLKPILAMVTADNAAGA